VKTIGIPSAWRLQHDVEVGIACLPLPHTQLNRLVTALERICVGRVGISTPYDDLTTSASGLRLARIALHTALKGQPVCVFGRDLLATAAASSPDIMKRVADTVLASLTKIPATDRALLLETFGTWLDSHGSATETAEKMFVHPNTVRHRLRRLEERTGRSLTSPRDIAELSIAFEIDRRNESPTPTTSPSYPAADRR
jgi:DNA-binding PucR family transcriptional regulator